jgi:hypothetical protein
METVCFADVRRVNHARSVEFDSVIADALDAESRVGVHPTDSFIDEELARDLHNVIVTVPGEVVGRHRSPHHVGCGASNAFRDHQRIRQAIRDLARRTRFVFG